MKNRFNTFDLICSLTELKKYVGLRVNQVYDIDNKTYLIRLQKTEEKVILLLESGNRIHTTGFEWPKNPSPSGFSMKLRKHLKNKRLESINQVGIDRIVDLQFGSGEAAHHVFLELFDRGNIMLTDHELTILYVLRPHTQGDRYIFAVKEKYPIERARCKGKALDKKEILSILNSAKEEETLRKVLTLQLEYGPALIEHVLLGVGLQGSSKIGKEADRMEYVDKLLDALNEAENIVQMAFLETSKGYVLQKIERRPTAGGGEDNLKVNLEFHPLLYRQHVSSLYEEHDNFDKAVDIFFSSLEGQKIDMKVVQQERDAVKKLENVKRDHHQRLDQLEQSKEVDKIKAELITKNLELVEKAIIGIRAMLANQIAWSEIQAMVKMAGSQGDEAAAAIKTLKLDINHIVLQLKDPYVEESDDEEENKAIKPIFVEIDLDLSAYANARKYYDQKRTATKKQEKTLESQGKALKSAEKRTKKALQEMKTIVNITKARKVFWFEKFFWFISSENYLVIAGRDAGQNELVVKRYMRAGDIYVHADIHGASSIVIKNPSGAPVPVKTLSEAGVMAICYSVAWEAKVITNSWWVHSDQVLKSAPSGEYLPTGSFSIRGKKNFLPPTNLILGFSFLFKLEEDSVFRHADERKVRSLDDDVSSISEMGGEDVEVILSDEEDQPLTEGVLNDDVEKNDSDIEDENEDKIKNASSEAESEDSENASKENDVISFPDTEIKIFHSGKEISLEAKTSIVIEQSNNDETVVYLGDQKPVILKSSTNKKVSPGEGKKSVKFQPSAKAEPLPEVNRLKRGQRSKLKKIKEKYRDQDEEDKKLRMEFLQASGNNKKNSKKEKKKQLAEQKLAPKVKSKIVPSKKDVAKGSGDESDEDQKEPLMNDDVAVISTLTGIPHVEDELLFAVPVIAPYTTLQNYKFKVKLTPGTGKRGKAARTALAIFLKDKTATQRERDILKGVKDEELARNIPGKVKLSAPQLHKK